MKARDYRRQIEQEAAGRADAVPATVAQEPADAWPGEIALLADPTAPTEDRLDALQSLQAGAFLGTHFEPYQPGFVDSLRRAATDANEQIRREALDTLANMKDEFARQKLIQGLTDAAEALVPPAVALGLLARDDHGSVSGIARNILESDAGRHVKAQAVRLLGADPNAHDLLVRLMQDKDEFREVRRASAAALQNLNPAAFAAKAQEILADETDFEDIRSSVSGALHRASISLRSAETLTAPTPADEASADDTVSVSDTLTPIGRAIGWLRGLFGSRTRVP